MSIPFCQCFASLVAALSCRLHLTLPGVHAPRGLNARIILKLKCCSSLWRNSVRKKIFQEEFSKQNHRDTPRPGFPNVTRIRESLDLEDCSEKVQKVPRDFNTTLKNTLTHQILVQKIICYLYVFNETRLGWEILLSTRTWIPQTPIQIYPPAPCVYSHLFVYHILQVASEFQRLSGTCAA